MRIFDITVPVRPAMAVWPGDPAPERSLAASMALGAECNLSRIALSAHTGTHLDAPRHFVADGATMEEIAPEVLVGPAQVVEVPHDGHVTAADLDAAGVRPGTTRLLLKTRNSRQRLMRDPAFQRDFAAVAADGARWLVDHGIRLIGVDYLSVEPFKAPGHPTHGTLLGAGVVALEGCDLADVPPGDYVLVCGPVLLEGSDGAPTRAFLLDGPVSPGGTE